MCYHALAGGNTQAIKLTATNETDVYDSTNAGIATGCYVVRVGLVTPGGWMGGWVVGWVGVHVLRCQVPESEPESC